MSVHRNDDPPDDDDFDQVFEDMVWDKFEGKMSDNVLSDVIVWAAKLRSDAYAEGYQRAQADAAEARDILETDKLAQEYWKEGRKLKDRFPD